ncbi:MAG: hypothetical protein HS111_29035 [Kofleriaceae bacterium]|nr:hypothetical protein [Kofleriaceae bacterium]
MTNPDPGAGGHAAADAAVGALIDGCTAATDTPQGRGALGTAIAVT